MKRIIVTGSRNWRNLYAVSRALFEHGRFGDTLIHGAAPGADTMADVFWRAIGPIERYPAEDFPTPRARNQHMVNLTADVVLAFATEWASGTGMTARMARKAGIPVVDYGVDTSMEARPKDARQ